MTTKSIRQFAIFAAPPAEVFRALTDPKQHAAFTGAAATGRAIVGGRFTAFDGYVQGVYRMLVLGKEIVADWRGNENQWPADHFSTITILLTKTKTGTRLSFTQTGVPAPCARAIADGWKTYYWKPLRQFLRRA